MYSATASSFCSVRPTPAPSYLGIHRNVLAQHLHESEPVKVVGALCGMAGRSAASLTEVLCSATRLLYHIER